MVRWFWVNFVLLIRIIVGQGPTVLAVGAGGRCLDIFSIVNHFSILSPSLNPKQPTKHDRPCSLHHTSMPEHEAYRSSHKMCLQN